MKKLAIGFFMLTTVANAQTVIDGSGLLTTTGTDYSIQFRSDWYSFEPVPDISSFEMALIFKTLMPGMMCTNSLTCPDVHGAIEALPPNVKRHFVYHAS